jgi:hypothetical protein
MIAARQRHHRRQLERRQSPQNPHHRPPRQRRITDERRRRRRAAQKPDEHAHESAGVVAVDDLMISQLSKSGHFDPVFADIDRSAEHRDGPQSRLDVAAGRDAPQR